jgi:acrylyl-CoA reductase (NADPH)
VPNDRFDALMLRESGGEVVAGIERIGLADLPDGDVTVAVQYSGLNYKDSLAITGQRHIARELPLVPGIDFAGIVENSESPRLTLGDAVVLTGWGVGETWWGGFAQKARVKSDWLVPLPAGMTARQSMAYGTAGLTAMLCVNAVDRHGIDRAREVLVTGAAGGVGSVAIVLLAKLGYRVTASRGRAEQAAYLKGLGAESVIDRSTLSSPSKPLLPERWGGVVDTIGSQTLATALAGVAYAGAVAATGLAGGWDLPATVLPFIRRGVTLIGIDSVYCPTPKRLDAWRRLTELLPTGLPGDVVEEINLADVPKRAKAILSGQVRGRIVVKIGH